MRILFVTGRFPYPTYRGDQARAFHHLSLLSRRHSVTLVTGGVDAVPAEGRRAIAAVCDEVIPVARSPLAATAGALRALAAGRPLQVGLYDTRALRATVEGLLAERRHDVLHVQLARMAGPFEDLDGIPRVVDLVDALSLNMARRQRRDHGPMAWAARFEQRRLERYERALCASFDAATVVAEADRLAIGAGLRGLVLNPNGVDLVRFPFREGPREADRIVFTGNLGYFPNVDAASWFAGEVLPRIRRAVPGATLDLVGARPARRLRTLPRRDPSIRVLSFVPDIAPHLARARVAVAPMRAGSGQLLKVLEAMASGTPVVATGVATSGLEIEDGRHLLLADSADGFARQVVRLLQDPPLAARLAREAHRLVQQRYTWERSVQELEAVYRSVIDAHASARRQLRTA
jgi:sugar transferase (PEP-CTERM/EpsH1 system associated)